MNIETLRNIIQSAHVNFLIGSGVSKPYLSTLGNIEIWLTELNNNPSNDKVKDAIVRCSILFDYLNGVIIPNLQATLSNHWKEWKIMKGRNISEEKQEEGGKTQQEKLVRSLGSTIENYKEFLKSINTLIMARHTNLHAKSVNVFTTNIDMLVEFASRGLGISINDGFSGREPAVFDDSNFSKQEVRISPHLLKTSEITTINYIKIHGSINWTMGENESIIADDALVNVQRVKEAFSRIQNSLIDVTKAADEFTNPESASFMDYLRDKVKYNSNNKEEMMAGLNEAISLYSKIIMVNPTKRKFRETVMDMPFYELMRLYSNALERENSVMIVAGFSFADEHLTRITLRAAANNPTLLILVLAYNEDEKVSISKAIKKRGAIQNDNIIIISPEEYKSENLNNKSEIKINGIDGLKYFDMESINKYILKPLASYTSN